MIRALLVLLTPQSVWTRLSETPPGVFRTLLLSLVPLVLLTGLAEGYGLLELGNKFGEFADPKRVPLDLVIRYEATYVILSLGLVMGGALIMQQVARSFQVRPSYGLCLAVVALGLAPVFWARLLDCVPTWNTWVCWATGALLAMRSLYHATIPMLKPDPPKTFGLYLVCTLILIPLSGLAHFLAVAVLLQDVTLPF